MDALSGVRHGTVESLKSLGAAGGEESASDWLCFKLSRPGEAVYSFLLKIQFRMISPIKNN